jgi:hypothetical protein
LQVHSSVPPLQRQFVEPYWHDSLARPVQLVFEVGGVEGQTAQSQFPDVVSQVQRSFGYWQMRP